MSFLRTYSVRIALGLVGFFGALFAPPWVPLIAMGLLALRYPAWEAIVIGLFVDLLWYAPSGVEGLSHPFILSLPLFTVAGLIMAWGFEPMRREFLIEKGGLL